MRATGALEKPHTTNPRSRCERPARSRSHTRRTRDRDASDRCAREGHTRRRRGPSIAIPRPPCRRPALRARLERDRRWGHLAPLDARSQLSAGQAQEGPRQPEGYGDDDSQILRVSALRWLSDSASDHPFLVAGVTELTTRGEAQEAQGARRAPAFRTRYRRLLPRLQHRGNEPASAHDGARLTRTSSTGHDR
jgi:hypothetical protein